MGGEQMQVHKSTGNSTQYGVRGKEADQWAADDAAAQANIQRDATALTEETEQLLDEIDTILEVNAEDFLRSFVQKGGE